MGEINQARAYGVRVLPTTSKGMPFWKVVEVRHLSPLENNGRRNVYVDVVGEEGQRLTDPTLRIGWRWEGQRSNEASPPVPLNKPDGEPMGDIPINPNQKLTVWIIGRYQNSEAVEGLHSMHPDEYENGIKGSYTAHHSFYIRFALTQPESGGDTPTTPTEPTPQPDLQTQLDALSARMAKVEAWLERLIGDL